MSLGLKILTGATLLGVLVFLVLNAHPAAQKPLGRRGLRAINVLQQVELGGVRQWISIRGTDTSRPVLLFLHGGPGSANLAKLRLQTPDLEEHFVVVNWDQRGAGKSFQPGLAETSLNLEQYVADAHDLVQILKTRFTVEKVYLLAFSWGNVIGLNLASRFPEDFFGVISVSPMVDLDQGEKISLEYTRKKAVESGSLKAQAELSQIDSSCCGPDGYADLMTERKWLLKFGGVYHTADSYEGEMKMLLAAPEYSLLEKAAWPVASSRSLKTVWPQLKGYKLIDTVARLNMPIVFFAGRFDFNEPSALTEAYFNAVEAPAGKQLIWFEESAHDIFMDEPRKLTDEIIRFSNR